MMAVVNQTVMASKIYTNDTVTLDIKRATEVKEATGYVQNSMFLSDSGKKHFSKYINRLHKIKKTVAFQICRFTLAWMFFFFLQIGKR